MADETTQHRDLSSGSTGQSPRDGRIDISGNNSSRRRVLITSLLTPPAVMTLNARRAHAASNHPSMDANYGDPPDPKKKKH